MSPKHTFGGLSALSPLQGMCAFPPFDTFPTARQGLSSTCSNFKSLGRSGSNAKLDDEWPRSTTTGPSLVSRSLNFIQVRTHSRTASKSSPAGIVAARKLSVSPSVSLERSSSPLKDLSVATSSPSRTAKK